MIDLSILSSVRRMFVDVWIVFDFLGNVRRIHYTRMEQLHYGLSYEFSMLMIEKR